MCYIPKMPTLPCAAYNGYEGWVYHCGRYQYFDPYPYCGGQLCLMELYQCETFYEVGPGMCASRGGFRAAGTVSAAGDSMQCERTAFYLGFAPIFAYTDRRGKEHPGLFGEEHIIDNERAWFAIRDGTRNIRILFKRDLTIQ